MRENFLENRRRGLGGSDISAILGYSDFSTPLKVWYSKVHGIDGEENKYTISGHYLESSVAQWFCDQHKIPPVSPTEMVIHKDYDFIVGNPDGVIEIEGEKAILECKTTYYSVKSGDIPIETCDPDGNGNFPMYWYLQLQWYMNICGVEKGYVAWLERGIDFSYREFTRDEELFKMLLEKAIEFWNAYVVTKTPPPFSDGADVELLHPKHAEGTYIDGTDEIYESYNRLINIAEEEKALSTEKTKIQDQLKMVIQDKEGIKYGDRTIITWKQNKRGSRTFNLKK